MANGGAINNSYYNRSQPNMAQPNNAAPNMGQPNNAAPNMGQFGGVGGVGGFGGLGGFGANNPMNFNASTASGQGAMPHNTPGPGVAGVQVGMGNPPGIGAPQPPSLAQQNARSTLDMSVGNTPVDLANDFNGDGRVTSADALARLKADTAVAGAQAPTQIGYPPQQPIQTTPPSSGATEEMGIPLMPLESTDAATAQNNQTAAGTAPNINQNATGTAPNINQNATGTAPNINQTAATGINNAISSSTNELNYRPIAVGQNGYNQAPAVEPGQVATTDLSVYMNPFEDQVVQSSLSDLDRARQMQQAQAGAQAGAAGAFGGSRQALLEAENNRNYFDQASRTASGLRQAGFQNAQNLGLSDIQTRLQADLANQGASNNAEQFNANQSMNSQIANQDAALRASQQRLSAANQLGNLSNLGFGMGQTVNQNLAQDGAMKQGINQLLIDAVKNQYAGYTGSPQQSLGLLSQALGVAPVPTTETTSKTPGLFDYLTLGASMSDMRLKTNIEQVGNLPSGLGIYTWDWTNDAMSNGLAGDMTIGVLAQEAQVVAPDAVVTTSSGYLAVDYQKLLKGL